METSQNNPKPRTIFDAINTNIVGLSEDMNLMHQKVDEVKGKIDMLYAALFQMHETEQREPNATGETTADKRNKVGGENV